MTRKLTEEEYHQILVLAEPQPDAKKRAVDLLKYVESLVSRDQRPHPFYSLPRKEAVARYTKFYTRPGEERTEKTGLDGLYKGKSSKIYALIREAYDRGVNRGVGLVWEMGQTISLREASANNPRNEDQVEGEPQLRDQFLRTFAGLSLRGLSTQSLVDLWKKHLGNSTQDAETLTIVLHRLIAAGKGDTAEADDVRDALVECLPSGHVLNELSGDLFSLHEEEILGPPPEGSSAAEQILAAWEDENWNQLRVLLILDFAKNIRVIEKAWLPKAVRAYLRGKAWEGLGYSNAAAEFYKFAKQLYSRVDDTWVRTELVDISAANRTKSRSA